MKYKSELFHVSFAKINYFMNPSECALAYQREQSSQQIGFLLT
jgi:hypothetical protein